MIDIKKVVSWQEVAVKRKKPLKSHLVLLRKIFFMEISKKKRKILIFGFSLCHLLQGDYLNLRLFYQEIQA